MSGCRDSIPWFLPAVYMPLPRFASILSLDVDHYTLDYAGAIVPKSGAEQQEIYSVRIR